MKRILPFLMGFLSLSVSAQVLEKEVLLDEPVSIRAIQLDQDRVWYAGSGGKLGYVSLKNPEEKHVSIVGSEKLEFRTLAQTRKAFYLINVGSPATIFEVRKSDGKISERHHDSSKDAFYDALHFVNQKLGFAFSDTEQDLLKVVYTKDGGTRWQILDRSVGVGPRGGASAFAASNSNIASAGKYIWIGTGGKVSEVIRLTRKGKKVTEAKAFQTPIIQGKQTTGIYTLDFANENFGIAAGGDYTDQDANENNIITTQDGGVHWTVRASRKNAGYITCVRIKPGSEGREILALGDQHISYSLDFGVTWQKISDEKDLYVFEWVDAQTIVAAGKNKILKITFKDL